MLYKGAFLLVTNKKENNIDSNLNKKLSGKMLARFLLYNIQKEKKRKGRAASHMNILVSNVGSTSLKFKLFTMPKEKLLCEAKIERIGSSDDAIFSYRNVCTDAQFKKTKCCVPTYSDGIKNFLEYMVSKEYGAIKSLGELGAVGFKTVLAKGYYGVHELTDEVLQGMKDYLFVAPAHNGPYLESISHFQRILPDIKLVGVFETAFHVTIPEARRMYAFPYEWYESYGIKRMGYHGASHSYIAHTLERDCGSSGLTISCHLGGSSSICAIQNGRSIDNSFGFSLQTGVLHANRIGDMDPYVIPFLIDKGMNMEDILICLSKKSGLLGISGVSNDLRQIQEAAEAGCQRSRLAIDMFVESVIHYIGAYYAKLGGLDNLVFTGGIGENSALVRSKICSAVSHMGIWLDEEKNREFCGDKRVVSVDSSPVSILVIPANEEVGIARDTYSFVTKHQ
jgi:acetate kinase